jgi:hypothetical protein
LYNFVPASAHSSRAKQARDPLPKRHFGTRQISLACGPVVALEREPASRAVTKL